MWEVEFYEKPNGRCPVVDFIKILSTKKDLPYFEHALHQLAEHGNQLLRPQVAYLENNIYELRVKTINGNFRLFYFFFDRSKIIITHGFKKKTSRIPKSELQKAQDYRTDYLARVKIS